MVLYSHKEQNTEQMEDLKMKNVNAMFTAAILAKHDPKNEIVAVAPDGREIKFTIDIFPYLKDDPTIAYIYSAYTGEIIWPEI
jgi:hypothetical protein